MDEKIFDWLTARAGRLASRWADEWKYEDRRRYQEVFVQEAEDEFGTHLDRKPVLRFSYNGHRITSASLFVYSREFRVKFC